MTKDEHRLDLHLTPQEHHQLVNLAEKRREAMGLRKANKSDTLRALIRDAAGKGTET